ncbi:MAG: CopG family transcriptional regulator [Acidimicrobiales bacterium]
MIRTQIQITQEQFEVLRQKASEQHMSMAALVRDMIDRALGDQRREQRVQRAFTVIGHFHSGTSDISAHHDRYLDEAFGL